MHQVESPPSMGRTLRFCALIVLAAGVITGLPVVLLWLNLPIISSTYGRTGLCYELFGFFYTAALIKVCWGALRGKELHSLEQVLPVLLPAAFSLSYLFVFTEHFEKSWDYACYEDAAKALVAGIDPYSVSFRCYLYPPMLAQSFAGFYRILAFVVGRAHAQGFADHLWELIFYFWQCLQFFALQLAWYLCYRFVRRSGLKPMPALWWVTGLFMVNSQLVRSMRHNQVNTLQLDLILGAVLLLEGLPVLAGLIVALGGQLKIYPLVLLGPWTLTRRWRALLGVVIGNVGWMLISTRGGTRWETWSQYLAFSRTLPKPQGVWFRDNSLHNLLTHTFGDLMRFGGVHTDIERSIVRWMTVVGSIGVIVWFGRRYLARERSWQAMGQEPGMEGSRSTFRMFGHAMDAIALGLIISPLVWEYHYVLAIPIVLWAASVRGSEQPWKVGIAAFLMFGIPTFDVFPFSFHRIAGLVATLVLTDPGRMAAGWRTRHEGESGRPR